MSRGGRKKRNKSPLASPRCFFLVRFFATKRLLPHGRGTVSRSRNDRRRRFSIAHLRFEGEKSHVWRASLDQSTSTVEFLARTLSPDERSLAERLYFHRDRTHHVIARGLLRERLGQYTGVEPSRLQFCYNSYGKPSLTSEYGGGVIKFNVSHSHGLALFAVAAPGGSRRVTTITARRSAQS
jgi:hypothetical protein